jgi:hypothetical protein
MSRSAPSFRCCNAPRAWSRRKAFLQPGAKQVCAGYAVYGPTTLLVLTLGDGVNVFTLDREYGTLRADAGNVRIPEDTREFAINMPPTPATGRHRSSATSTNCWPARTGPRGKDFNMRWVASMVADVHRILTRGGIFMYPIDSKTGPRAASCASCTKPIRWPSSSSRRAARPPTAAATHPRHPAGETAPARAGDPRFEERSGAGNGLPRSLRQMPQSCWP